MINSTRPIQPDVLMIHHNCDSDFGASPADSVVPADGAAAVSAAGSFSAWAAAEMGRSTGKASAASRISHIHGLAGERRSSKDISISVTSDGHAVCGWRDSLTLISFEET